jgi:hypothetical protein
MDTTIVFSILLLMTTPLLSLIGIE